MWQNWTQLPIILQMNSESIIPNENRSQSNLYVERKSPQIYIRGEQNSYYRAGREEWGAEWRHDWSIQRLIR
jgi:hypothetical protein